jgi:hypothetical protein
MVVLQMSSTPEKSRTKWLPVGSIRTGSESTPNSAPVGHDESSNGHDEVRSPDVPATLGSASISPIESHHLATDELQSTSADDERRTSADPAKVSVFCTIYANC